MEAAIRRTEILARLDSATAPLAAATLGEELGVSRQVIVGDVALLRASGHPVYATSRGYVMPRASTRPRRSFLVRHGRAEIAPEMETVLDAGGALLDTSVEHPLYGQLTVDLLIRNQDDLTLFLERIEGASVLFELTDGWHTHTIEASTEAELDEIGRRLNALGVLRQSDEQA